MELRKEIAARITKARKEKGITIKELAARTQELSPARIGNWEQGTRSPGPTETKLLAEQLGVSASYLLCLTDHPLGDLVNNSCHGMRAIPVLTMPEAVLAKKIVSSFEVANDDTHIVVDSFNKSLKSTCLFAAIVENNSMQPDLNPGDLVIIDGDRAPKPGDFVLAYLPAKQQTVLRKYSESGDGLFQLLASNELWAAVSVRAVEEATIIGVVVERRRYSQESV